MAKDKILVLINSKSTKRMQVSSDFEQPQRVLKIIDNSEVEVKILSTCPFCIKEVFKVRLARLTRVVTMMGLQLHQQPDL